MTNTYLTPAEIERLTDHQADYYRRATDQEKAETAEDFRASWAAGEPLPDHYPPSTPLTLKTVGAGAFAVGVFVSVILLMISASDDAPPAWFTTLAMAVGGLGFWAWMFGIIEERLIAINDSIQSLKPGA